MCLRLFFYNFHHSLVILQTYNKLPKTQAQLIAKLKQQGLIILDSTAAEDFLKKVSYYRFRGYLYPYFDISQNSSPRPFKPNSTFENIKEIYCFDEDLRKLLFGVMPEIEVALRTALDTTISPIVGNGFWYLNNHVIKNNALLDKVRTKLLTEFTRSKEKFATHYLSNYTNNISPAYPTMPPFWVICELATIGQLKVIFDNIESTHSSIHFPLIQMSKAFGAKNFKELVNWVHAVRDLRNLCAHHSRLWNRNLFAPSGIQKKVSHTSIPLPNTNRQAPNSIYLTILMLHIICKHQNIKDGLKEGLITLLQKYPQASVHKGSMGMPPDWQDDKIWL